MEKLLFDTSYLMGHGPIPASLATISTTHAVRREIVSKGVNLPFAITTIQDVPGPSLKDFSNNENQVFIWSSSDTNTSFQVSHLNGHFKAICNRHPASYQFTFIEKGKYWCICEPLFQKPDLSLLTATMLEPAFSLKSFDLCLVNSVNKVKEDLKSTTT